MLFTIKNYTKTNIDYLRTNTLLAAYDTIQSFPMRGAEIILDEYLKKQYKTSLKDACVDLLLHMTFYANNDGDLVLLFKNKKYDNLAQLITFGNGTIKGSQILQEAFST